MLRKLVKVCIIGFLFSLFVPYVIFAELPYLPMDIYVREADLIIEGEIVSGSSDENETYLVDIEVIKTFYGKVQNYVKVIAPKRATEDLPTYKIGEHVVLFLCKSKLKNYYYCFQGEACKVNINGDKINSFYFSFKDKEEFSNTLEAFVLVKQTQNLDLQIQYLIKLLDSKNTFTITAASNYLNFLINKEEKEGWYINPPENSNWSYHNYYNKNAYYKRKKWQNWYLGRLQQDIIEFSRIIYKRLGIYNNPLLNGLNLFLP